MTKFYVTMTDKFLSGWGQAEGRINKLVIECDSYDEAVVVANNARHRSEMKYVNINSRNNYKNDTTRVKVSFHTKEDYGSWFQPGYFAQRQALSEIEKEKEK